MILERLILLAKRTLYMTMILQVESKEEIFKLGAFVARASTLVEQKGGP